MVCNGFEIEPVLQEITGEELNMGANTAPDARLDIAARGVWERQSSAFLDVRICHPNADCYRDMDPNQIYRQHETEKKRRYASRILEMEQNAFQTKMWHSNLGKFRRVLVFDSEKVCVSDRFWLIGRRQKSVQSSLAGTIHPV